MQQTVSKTLTVMSISAGLACVIAQSASAQAFAGKQSGYWAGEFVTVPAAPFSSSIQVGDVLILKLRKSHLAVVQYSIFVNSDVGSRPELDLDLNDCDGRVNAPCFHIKGARLASAQFSPTENCAFSGACHTSLNGIAFIDVDELESLEPGLWVNQPLKVELILNNNSNFGATGSWEASFIAISARLEKKKKGP